MITYIQMYANTHTHTHTHTHIYVHTKPIVVTLASSLDPAIVGV